MPTPSITAAEFAERLRGDRVYGSDRERADVLRQSEDVAAAAFEFVAYGGTQERGCRQFIASRLGLRPSIVGLPPIVIQLFWGLATRLLVELIVKAAELLIEVLRTPERA